MCRPPRPLPFLPLPARPAGRPLPPPPPARLAPLLTLPFERLPLGTARLPLLPPLSPLPFPSQLLAAQAAPPLARRRLRLLPSLPRELLLGRLPLRRVLRYKG